MLFYDDIDRIRLLFNVQYDIMLMPHKGLAILLMVKSPTLY